MEQAYMLFHLCLACINYHKTHKCSTMLHTYLSEFYPNRTQNGTDKMQKSADAFIPANEYSRTKNKCGYQPGSWEIPSETELLYSTISMRSASIIHIPSAVTDCYSCPSTPWKKYITCKIFYLLCWSHSQILDNVLIKTLISVQVWVHVSVPS